MKFQTCLLSTFAIASNAFVLPTGTSQVQKQTVTVTQSPVGKSTSLPVSFGFGEFATEESKPGVHVVQTDYRLAFFFYVVGAIILAFGSTNEFGEVVTPSTHDSMASFLHLVIGVFFWKQARTLRCVFEKGTFRILQRDVKKDKSVSMRSSGENYVVGGENRWACNKITNWEFFPSIEFPVLCYFKEIETPKEKWGQTLAKFDPKQDGQVHFFPAFVNPYELQEQFIRNGAKKAE